MTTPPDAITAHDQEIAAYNAGYRAGAAAERDRIRVTPEVMRAADVAYIAAEGKQACRRGLLAALETFAYLLRGDRP